MIDEDIVTALLGEATINTKIASGSVFSEFLPQDADYPAIVYSVNQSQPNNQFGSAAPSVVPMNLTLSVYAKQRSTLRQLDQAIIDFLHRYSGDTLGTATVTGVRVEQAVRTYDEKTKNHRSVIQLNFNEV